MNKKEDLKEIINNYFLMRKERIHKDIIFADGCMERMIPDFKGIFVDTRQFAVSGKLIGE